MNGRRTFGAFALVLGLGVLLSGVAWAVPPWAKLLSTNRVEADPAKSYTLKEENGPYLIMACSFSGEGADQQAHDLALELRKRYKLEAFTHNMRLSLDDPNKGNSLRPPPGYKWQYKKFHDRPVMKKDGAIKEIAVLVGNYASVEDPEAQKALNKLKYTEPDCLKTDGGKPIARTLAGLRSMQQIARENLFPDTSDQRKRGPMGHAFLTTNPLLPPGYYAPKGAVDELVLKMNKGVKHSLLDCPGKYTVQVARFTGEVVIEQNKIQAIESGTTPGPESSKQLLAKAAEKAHTLSEALRIDGYEAYEFHDRYASIVTVGSFDDVGTPRADGKTEINPRIHAIMKHFGGEPINIPGQPPGAMRVKSLVGINFDIQAIPVEVPKRSISRELARRLVREE